MRFLASLLVGLLISATAFGGGSTTAGVPNPAAALCVNLGGKLIGVNVTGGQAGFCQFGERALIDEWTLYREVALHEKTLAVATLRANAGRGHAVVSPNPASGYCINAGGKLETGTLANRDQIGLCKFSDGSSIEEWTLWRGTWSPENAPLLNVLK